MSGSITRIQNNQITDSTIVGYAKIASGSLYGNLFAPTLTLNSNVTITGNLFLSNTGNTATINATNTYINDPVVTFNNGYTGTLTHYDIGMLVNRNLTNLPGYGSVNAAWVWSEDQQAFVSLITTNSGTSEGPNLSFAGYANVVLGNTTINGAQTINGNLNIPMGYSATFNGPVAFNGTLTTATISSASYQGVIGNVTPYPGYFSDVIASNVFAATIGNIGSNIVGVGTYLTALNASALSSGNVSSSVINGAYTGITQVGALTGLTVTGTTSLNTVTASTVQAATIGNTGAAITGSTGTFNTVTTGGLQAVAIGNVTPGSAVFTTVNTLGNIYANSATGSLTIYGNAISSNTGKIGLGSISNVQITGGSSGSIVTTDGNGNLSFVSLLGNNIPLGANVSGQLVSNAVSLTTSTDVTDAVAQLNAILGKLVPNAPTNFPTSTAATGTAEYSGYMTTGWSQTDNSGWGNLAVNGGTLLANTTRVTTFSINSITNNGTTAAGGTIQLYVNGSIPGSSYHTFGTTASSADNGTYGQITITNAEDYHVVSSGVQAGFWYVFSVSSAMTGISSGWNRANLYYTGDATGTNTITWYYDASSPSAPSFSATSIALSSNTVTYSSTIPHLNSSAGFTLTGTVQNLSGDLYYSGWSSTGSNFFSTTTAGGALLTPANRTLTQVGVPLPLTRSNTTPYTFTTTANVTTGFGSSAATSGPSVTVATPYTSSSQTFQQGSIVLYKTGTSTQIEETALTNSLSGAPSTYRIVNPDGGTASDTPSYTGSESAFNSSTGTLLSTDATVVAAKLQYDVTNYSTGYYPAGPNLSSGRSSSQYFTFKFSEAALSTFHINYTGTLAGLWMACPGVTDTPAAPSNGWLNCAASYGGAGVPGTGTGGNGSNGCAVGGNATLNSNGSYSVQVTLGSVNTSSAGNKSNEIYVRVKLTSGQSLTALSIAT